MLNFILYLILLAIILLAMMFSQCLILSEVILVYIVHESDQEHQVFLHVLSCVQTFMAIIYAVIVV
jgi:hypothetical protein